MCSTWVRIPHKGNLICRVVKGGYFTPMISETQTKIRCYDRVVKEIDLSSIGSKSAQVRTLLALYISFYTAIIFMIHVKKHQVKTENNNLKVPWLSWLERGAYSKCYAYEG